MRRNQELHQKFKKIFIEIKRKLPLAFYGHHKRMEPEMIANKTSPSRKIVKR